MNRSDTISELAKALAKAQGQIEHAKKDCKNAHIGNTYADLASVWAACKEALTANGLSVVQAPGEIIEGKISVETMLLHTSGEWMSSALTMPVVQQVKGEGWKETMSPQAVGSVITYARRYALAAMVGVIQDDDDAEAGMNRPQQQQKSQQTAHKPQPGQAKPNGASGLTDAQVKRLFAIAKQHNLSNEALKAQMQTHIGKDSTKDLTKAEYDKLCDEIIPATVKATA